MPDQNYIDNLSEDDYLSLCYHLASIEFYFRLKSKFNTANIVDSYFNLIYNCLEGDPLSAIYQTLSYLNRLLKVERSKILDLTYPAQWEIIEEIKNGIISKDFIKNYSKELTFFR